MDAARGSRNAAALAIVALSASLLTPYLFQRTIAARRQVITSSLGPARDATSDVRLALAREVGAIRGYLLTHDSALVTEYRLARSDQDRAFAELARVSGLDTAIQRGVRELDAAVREWNETNDLLARGSIKPGDARDRLPVQQQKYRAALNATEAIENRVTRDVEERRVIVGSLESWWAAASIGLAILAAAAAMVIVMMRSSHRQSALARADPLTRLYNRLGFDELATRELSRARRNRTPITLLIFDLDGFKQVNDERGHAAGDDLLRTVGDAIRRTIRDIDVAARLGGDEFAVLLPDNRATPPERAVERVRDAIHASLERHQRPVTLSVGAITLRDHPMSIDEMIHTADTLMYRVKNTGKNAMRHELIADALQEARSANRASVS
jgi:diguanylate cyclase (GGDEF)-like protein